MIKYVISEDQSIEEAQKAIEKTIKNIKEKVNRDYQIYKKSKYIYNSQQFETVRYIAKNIFAGTAILNDADEDLNDLLNEIIDFSTKAKPKDNYDWYKCSL